MLLQVTPQLEETLWAPTRNTDPESSSFTLMLEEPASMIESLRGCIFHVVGSLSDSHQHTLYKNKNK